ncbi:MAG TPA: GTP-binding protein, partial [Streptosporangiaceae bacterium]
MHTLNLGILAHVDAGKTSLTERLLYAAGVIGEVGSVDDGSTQTDTLALERQRGITIKSAVVSFTIGGVTVNLIDTPGHPDFIAEVERVLGVLDGAVLVISAVEGVQAQTRILMRALRRLRIPVLIFVNKIDRRGARGAAVLAEITARLGVTAVPMGVPDGLGTRAASVTPLRPADPGGAERLAAVLAEHDDGLLAAYLADPAAIGAGRLRRALAAQTAAAQVCPAYFGSAITGAGTGELADGIARLLPAASGDPAGPLSGTVFKVERGPGGEKIACARLFSGTVATRGRLSYGDTEDKVTAIGVYDGGPAARRPLASAGQIARLWGLAGVRIGDTLGAPPPGRPAAGGNFAPPTLETVVVPDRPADMGALHAA